MAVAGEGAPGVPAAARGLPAGRHGTPVAHVADTYTTLRNYGTGRP
jgi:hypothetical protein